MWMLWKLNLLFDGQNKLFTANIRQSSVIGNQISLVIILFY